MLDSPPAEANDFGKQFAYIRGVMTIPPDDVTDMQTITIAISWESPVKVNSVMNRAVRIHLSV